jgi:hypothetical protein
MLSRFVSCVAGVVLTVLAIDATAQVREEKRNFVGGELLGRGVIVTLNYERWVTNQVGLGSGVMAIGTSEGAAFILPLYVAYASGDVHSLYVSGGTSYLGGGDVNDYEDLWLITASVGYQFHSYGGFFVRPLFTLFLPTTGEDEFLIWPGITIGGSF